MSANPDNIHYLPQRIPLQEKSNEVVEMIKSVGPVAFSIWSVMKTYTQNGEGRVSPRMTQKEWAEQVRIKETSFRHHLKILTDQGLIDTISPVMKHLPMEYVIHEFGPRKARFRNLVFQGSLYNIRHNINIKDIKTSLINSFSENTLHTTMNEGTKEEIYTSIKDRVRENAIKKVGPPPPPPPTNPLIEYWNSLPGPHPKHKDTSTDIYEGLTRDLRNLRRGKLFEGCKWSDRWEKKIKEKRFDTKKWTKDEIKEGLRRISLYFQKEYWPEMKKSIPHNLSALLYNPYGKTSWFLMAMIDKPVPFNKQHQGKPQEDTNREEERRKRAREWKETNAKGIKEMVRAGWDYDSEGRTVRWDRIVPERQFYAIVARELELEKEKGYLTEDEFHKILDSGKTMTEDEYNTFVEGLNRRYESNSK